MAAHGGSSSTQDGESSAPAAAGAASRLPGRGGRARSLTRPSSGKRGVLSGKDGRTGGRACLRRGGQPAGTRTVAGDSRPCLRPSEAGWRAGAGGEGCWLLSKDALGGQPARARRREADLGWPGGYREAGAHLHPGTRGSGAGGAHAAGEPAPGESESRERALGRGLPSPECRRGHPFFLPGVTLLERRADRLYERGLTYGNGKPVDSPA